MADIVSVRYDGADERAGGGRHGPGGDSFTSRASASGTAKGDSKRWHRKGH